MDTLTLIIVLMIGTLKDVHPHIMNDLGNLFIVNFICSIWAASGRISSMTKVNILILCLFDWGSIKDILSA